MCGAELIAYGRISRGGGWAVRRYSGCCFLHSAYCFCPLMHKRGAGNEPRRHSRLYFDGLVCHAVRCGDMDVRSLTQERAVRPPALPRMCSNSASTPASAGRTPWRRKLRSKRRFSFLPICSALSQASASFTRLRSVGPRDRWRRSSVPSRRLGSM